MWTTERNRTDYTKLKITWNGALHLMHYRKSSSRSEVLFRTKWKLQWSIENCINSSDVSSKMFRYCNIGKKIYPIWESSSRFLCNDIVHKIEVSISVQLFVILFANWILIISINLSSTIFVRYTLARFNKLFVTILILINVSIYDYCILDRASSHFWQMY